MTHERFKSLKEVSYKDDVFFLQICPLEEVHAEIIHSTVMLSREHFLPFMCWMHRELSVVGQRERIRASRELWTKGKEYDFSVFDQATRGFLMSATLRQAKVPNKNAFEIGYWTSALHCNKGLATLVTKILTVIAFDFLKVDRAEIFCNRSNKKSRRVAEKCGFIFEGDIRNYFSEPTPEMIKNGFHPDRTCSGYSLTSQDLETLFWFDEIKKKIHLSF